jgi:hypothetical protein
MNNKPDETTLISYLYGELGEKEKQKVDLYFEEHPEERKHLQSLAAAREILASVKDKEVIAPPIFLDSTPVIPIWRSGFFKVAASIAATFLVIMVSARLIGTEIVYSQGELRISLGKKQEPVQKIAATPGLTPEQVQAMITSTVVKNNEILASGWTEGQQKMDASIKNRLDQNSKKMDAIVTNASLASQEQVRTFVDGLQNQNLKLMKDYLQLSSKEQKEYVESLLVDFSKYLQEQRNQDLNVFQTRLRSVETETDQFKQETEQLLSSFISNAGSAKNKNSY